METWTGLAGASPGAAGAPPPRRGGGLVAQGHDGALGVCDQMRLAEERHEHAAGHGHAAGQAGAARRVGRRPVAQGLVERLLKTRRRAHR